MKDNGERIPVGEQNDVRTATLHPTATQELATQQTCGRKALALLSLAGGQNQVLNVNHHFIEQPAD
jgi:hypothetical protein